MVYTRDCEYKLEWFNSSILAQNGLILEEEKKNIKKTQTKYHLKQKNI